MAAVHGPCAGAGQLGGQGPSAGKSRGLLRVEGVVHPVWRVVGGSEELL